MVIFCYCQLMIHDFRPLLTPVKIFSVTAREWQAAGVDVGVRLLRARQEDLLLFARGLHQPHPPRLPHLQHPVLITSTINF